MPPTNQVSANIPQQTNHLPAILMSEDELDTIIGI